MIVPITDEAGWRPFLATAELWRPPLLPIIIVSPHPDDETLATGGLITWASTLGINVRVLAVTDGENAYGHDPDLARVRQLEQESALEVFGVKADQVTRLKLTDSAVATQEGELIDALAAMASADTHIVAPWPNDFHPDHESCGRAARVVSRRTGALLTYYFFWTWHRGTPSLLKNVPLLRFPLDESLRDAKLAALSHYASQLQHPSGQPILPKRILWPAMQSFEIYLPT